MTSIRNFLFSRPVFSIALGMAVLLLFSIGGIAFRAANAGARGAEDEHSHKKEEHEDHDHSHEHGDHEHPAGVVLMPIEQQWAIKLKHVPVVEAEMPGQIVSTGRIIPAMGHQVIVAPAVGGMITGGRLPRVGQRVTKGQTLAVLRQQVSAAEAAQISVGRAQLQIEQARLVAERRRMAQEVERAKADYDLAVVALDHANKLYARKAYSVHQQLEAKAKQQTAEASYKAAVEQLEALNAIQLPDIDASVSASGHPIVAPISGTVVKVRKAEGDHVTVGEAILEIVNLDTVWIEAPVFERDLHLLTKGARALFTTPAFPATEFKASMVDLGAVVDEQTRAASVIFEAPNAGRALLIGMQANLRMDFGAKADVLLIPKDAVQENEGRKMVFVVLTGEEFEPRDVTLGSAYGEQIAVLDGLQAGERIVTQGAYQLRLRQLRPTGGGDEHAGHNHAH